MEADGFMLDMDGTVYMGDRMIPGASDFIAALKAKGIPFMFVTNNSSHTRQYYYDRLTRLGFDVELGNVLTSTVAACKFIQTERPGKKVYPVASPEVIAEMKCLGLRIVDEDPDIVLLTFDRTITYDKINRAYHLIKEGVEFIATHPDDVCPTEDGYDIDIGPFIRMFEQMCQAKAVVVGKPNRLLMEMGARVMGVDPSRTVMVGDRLYTDMEMAIRAGITSILVLSGETSREEYEAWDKETTYVLDSVKDIIPLL